MAEEKTTFCRSLDWPSRVDWYDRLGLYPLYNTPCVAQLCLDVRGTIGVYPGFRVAIVHPCNGKICEHYFLFDDYLPTDMANRQDERHDYPRPGEYCFRVLPSQGWDWFIAIPKNTFAFTAAVCRYIDAMDRDCGTYVVQA